MWPGLFVPICILSLLCATRALPSNGTLIARSSEDVHWDLRARTMLPFVESDLRADCFGVRMRSIGGPLGTKSSDQVKYPGWRDQVGPRECVDAAPSRSKMALYYRAEPAQVSAATKIPKETELQWKTADYRADHPDSFTCDHVVEISMLMDVLNAPGGVCKTAKARYDACANASAAQKAFVEGNLRKDIIQIREIVNGKKNLVFLQRRIEEIKTMNKINFNKNVKRAVGFNDMDYLAVTDYLLEKTLANSQPIADAIDRKIAALFGDNVANAASMGARWREYIAFTREEHAAAKKKVTDDIAKMKKELADAAKKSQEQCGVPKPAPGGPWGQPRGPWGKPAPAQGGGASGSTGSSRRALARRQHLDRRAPAVRGASRAGPHAPPARACPLPGQPPKPIVPRSQMQIKPAPAKRPRVPAQKPPVKPLAVKKVVPRPVNRPRREVGKPAPPKKRVTPKKQPKRVPKPASKPKGKPRPRKRK